MLPSAAGFIDPMFSTGIPLTLLGIERIGRILSESWGSSDLDSRLEEYGQVTYQELDWTARLVSASYASFREFPAFVGLSMFYFAAASYSEMTRRLRRPDLVRRFLAADRNDFAPGMAACEDAIQNGSSGFDLDERVANWISPLNIAGLSDPSKRNWYGVDLEDLATHAGKLGFTQGRMRDILANAPWAKAACRTPSDSTVTHI